VTFTCGAAGGRRKDRNECGQVRPTLTLCPWHDPTSTVSMAHLGGQGAARAKLVPERISLRTPEQQAAVLERAVAARRPSGRGGHRGRQGGCACTRTPSSNAG
jgi:hypothetical protein